MKKKFDKSGTYSRGGRNFAIVESYKSLRTNLQFALSVNEDKILLVTSAEANAGKSTTISNVAVAMAQAGSRVLLIDADMRQPTQHKVFKRSNQLGLSNILSSFCTLEEAIHEEVLPNLDLISSGTIPPNPSELLVSRSMSELLDAVKGKYDYVFIDTPPVGVVSDAMTLLDRVPSVLVIARQKQTTYGDFNAAVELITQNGGTVIGSVITNVHERDRMYGDYDRRGRYGYGNKYYYGGYYGSRKNAAADEENA